MVRLDAGVGGKNVTVFAYFHSDVVSLLFFATLGESWVIIGRDYDWENLPSVKTEFFSVLLSVKNKWDKLWFSSFYHHSKQFRNPP